MYRHWTNPCFCHHDTKYPIIMLPALTFWTSITIHRHWAAFWRPWEPNIVWFSSPEVPRTISYLPSASSCPSISKRSLFSGLGASLTSAPRFSCLSLLHTIWFIFWNFSEVWNDTKIAKESPINPATTQTSRITHYNITSSKAAA